jgi:hypothetical protein
LFWQLGWPLCIKVARPSISCGAWATCCCPDTG